VSSDGTASRRWREADWWLGRTLEQRARRDTAWAEFRAARAEVRRAWRTSKESTGGSGDRSGGSSDARFGARVGAVGKVLTIGITLPVIAAALFGPVGLILAVPLAVLLLVGRAGSGREAG